MKSITYLSVILLTILIACGQPTPPTTTNGSPADRQVNLPDTIPPVDTSKHSVPLSEIYFDTFQSTNRAVPLDKADENLIQRLQDAIPPIHNPKYELASNANWLADNDIILGYAVDGEAWAYPIRILNYHEIVNEQLGGEPILISYCPLCYSGVVYSRQVGDQVLTFGNTSALYESDMVMLDYDTGSYWWQVAGRGIVGELTDTQLTVLPSQMATWEAWQQLYPNTLVLSQDTGFSRNYGRDSFAGYAGILNNNQFAFPVSQAGQDNRLPAGEKVLVVRMGEEVKAYTLERPQITVIEDTISGEKVVIFIDPHADTGNAFLPENLLFQVKNGTFIDVELGRMWNVAGQSADGGSSLQVLPTKTTFWFAAVASEPDIVVVE